METSKTYNDLLRELEQTRMELYGANATIDAIRNGEVDALVVEMEKGHELFAIKSLNQTYRLFIEKMNEGAVTINKEGTILYGNSEFASIVNTRLDKVIGFPLIDFVPLEYKEICTKIIDDGWESDCRREISFQNNKGELVPFLLSVASLELDEGTALSIIFTNLSFQKENERQLQLKNEQLAEARRKAEKINEELEDIVNTRTNDLSVSVERFKFLADNIPAIIWTAEPNGWANYFNKLWCEYTGLSVEESQGSGSQQVLHPDDHDSIVNAWENAIKSQIQFRFEYRIRRASDGQYRWHLGIGIPFKDKAGNVTAWFGTATDIENHKREIEKKDEFMSIASHELRTPLTSLKGYIQLIESQINLPDDVSLYLSKASNSVNKLEHLVNDLLDVSKIKAGKLKFTTHSFNLSDIINACVDNCRYIYPAYNIKKELEKDIFIEGNEERLEQVLMNLISNSVKYSKENKEIIIRSEKVDHHGVVSVIDFGIGMSETEQLRIFERFYRVEDSKFHVSGLGMGLYICAQIIKEHQGSITVKSILKKGSTFAFSLPLSKV